MNGNGNRQSYPLSLLLVILTGCAVLAAILAPLVRNFHWEDWLDHIEHLVVAIIVCIVGGALLGVFVGLHQFRQLQGIVSGAILGAVIALLSGLLMTIDRQSMGSVVPAVLIGCVILVATAWLIRPPLKRDDEEEVVDAVEAPPK